MLGGVELTGQWVDFYAMLAVNRTSERGAEELVPAEAVARIGPWRHKAAKSVGKEVARHLDDLSDRGLDGIVQFQRRTKAWRLNTANESLVFVPDRATVESWVQARLLVREREDGWVDCIRALVDASIALQHGKAEEVLCRLEELSEKLRDAEPELSAWCALLSGKAADQHDDEEETLLNELHDRWRRRADSLGKAVSVRLRAILARRHRFEDPAATLASLTKLAGELEGAGDLGGLGAVLNVAGLLARRTGDPNGATAHHLRAAALFGIVGDYASLQAAVFNLAICRRAASAVRGEPPDENVLALVDTNKRITACFGVGSDSAQAEIAGAAWAQEMGDSGRARQFLQEAEALLHTIESTYDQAFFFETRARIEMEMATGDSEPACDLDKAEKLYLDAGDAASSKRVRDMASSIRASGRCAAKCRRPRPRRRAR